jgi:acetylornithine deacetylase/succinyl-diaminopimelate desuccinylase-like protein
VAGGLDEAVRLLMPAARADLERLVALRSVADPAVEPVEECTAAADLVESLLVEAGLDSVTKRPTPDGSLAVFGRTVAPVRGPTVLLYSHYDVQPAGPSEDWGSDPWTLTERDGRWYGRGAADCKGNLVATLTALRALRQVASGQWPVGVTLVCEGSEEQSSGGLEQLVRSQPDLVRADAVVIADTGNVALGVPTLTTSLRGTGSVRVTVRTLDRPAHSGMFGGAAPDALQALVMALASIRDEAGNTTIEGLDRGGRWTGAPYDLHSFRHDAGVLDGVKVLEGDADVGSMLWSRPAATVLAIDAPAVSGATAAVQGEARALVNLRVPPGVDAGRAQQALIEHLRNHVPWQAQVELEPVSLGQPFAARTDGPAFRAMAAAMAEAFGHPVATTGQGGSIPLTVTLADLMPDAEFLMLGVEEPASRIHAPNESVHPEELRRTALALALFLASFGDLSDSEPAMTG